jgi:hypothetical protein
MRTRLRHLRSLSFWASDDGANWAFRVALAVSLPIFAAVGRRQWFIRDDWAFLLTRNVLRTTRGIDDWLLTAQDGHWMTPPILVYRLIQNVFGIDSYWPYLLPTLALHVTAVLLARQVCRRVQVSPWTTTLLCSMLLVFGSGWENIVFAIQITYNLSLAAFLVQVLLVDHEGPIDRRDIVGAVVGLIGVMSSGFGPFFAFGVFVLLATRRRWRAAAVAVVPQGLAYGWWLLTWSTDGAAAAMPGPRSQVPAFAMRGITATFESLVAVPALAGVAIVGTIAITLWPAPSWRTRTFAFALWAVVVSMFLGVGSQRIGFGLDSAAASRYQHIAAILLVPVFGLAVDRVRHWSLPGLRAVQVLLGIAVVLNAGWLQTNGAEWANRARDARLTYELVVGSPLAGTVDPQIRPEPFNPDVTVAWLPYLLQQGAIEARTPHTPEELARVDTALGLTPTGG